MRTKKIALITGANKGIGLETARQLGQKQMTVLLGVRDQKKGKEAVAKLRKEGLDARALVLDVSESASIRKAAAQVQKEFGRLDVLVNNAAIMIDEKDRNVSEQSLQVWRDTFATNFFGLVETTQAFLPLLRKSEAGRIVNLSSVLGSITLHAQPGSPIYGNQGGAYDVSKSAVNAYTVQLASELKNTKIKVNAADPGWVKTEMGGAGATMEIAEGARTSVQLATLAADGPNGAYLHDGAPLAW